jgi:4-oxalocrotonate tautomerase
MPIVTVQITKEGVTREQKAAVIQGITKVLEDVLQKAPHLTYVVIQEVELDDWGAGGLQVSEHRRARGDLRSHEEESTARTANK